MTLYMATCMTMVRYCDHRRSNHLLDMDETDRSRTAADHLVRHDAERIPPASKPTDAELPPEIGGPKGPEPTRFGDWEQKGRCTDF